MRRKDREMPRQFAAKIIDKCIYATLATVDISGNPYCIPISLARDGDVIYFHCAHEGEKIKNMRHNPKVCISCVGETHVPDGEFTIEYESAGCLWYSKRSNAVRRKNQRPSLIVYSPYTGKYGGF